jgi:hypothetical protein
VLRRPTGYRLDMPTDDDLPDPDPIDEEMANIDARDPDIVEEIEEVKEDAEALGRDVEDPPV